MAAFNPETRDTGLPNNTGASQGQIPDRSFEALFEGLTKTFENVTNIKDQQTQLDIRQDAEEMFTSVNQEFGVEPPAAMADELSRVQELQNAVEQGKISQVNYYGRLATLSKQLRTKYPRYEKIVDETIQSVTGTRPANAYRDAIFQEIGSLQESASDSAKFRRQYEKEFQGEIAATIGPEYFENPEAYDFEKVQIEVSKFKGNSEKIDAEVRELNLLEKQGQHNEVRAKKALDNHMNFVVSSVMTRSLGLNKPNAQDSIDAFIAKGGGSPEELDQFIGTISQVEAEIRAELTKTGREKFGGIMTNAQINESVESALYPLTKSKEAVLGGDFKLAARFATINKSSTDQQVNEMLNDPSGVYRAGAGISEINQTLGDTFFNENKDTAIQVATEIAGQAMAGNKGIVKKIISSGNEKVSRAVLSEAFRSIINPKLTDEKFSNVLNEFFGPEAEDFMSPKVVAKEDLQKIYLSFLRPEVTQAIFLKGTPEDKQRYVDWAMTKAVAIPEFRAAAGDLNSLKKFDPNLEIVFNADSMKLEIKTSGPNLANALGWKPYGAVTGSFNRVMDVLAPIWDANGDDPREKALELVKSFSIELEGQNPELQGSTNQGETLWGAVFNSIVSSASASEGGTDEDEGGLEDDPDIDFMTTQAIEEGGRRTTPTRSTEADEPTRNILDMIGQAEGAGYDTIFGHNERRYGIVPTEMTLEEVFKVQRRMGNELGSSAFGKYQVIQKTLKNAVKEMGLPLDTVFTEEVQDAVALHLLKERGYDLYRQGKMKGREFLNNLAKEWASVPNSSGRSHYAGDKMGNNATPAGRKLARQFS